MRNYGATQPFSAQQFHPSLMSFTIKDYLYCFYTAGKHSYSNLMPTYAGISVGMKLFRHKAEFA